MSLIFKDIQPLSEVFCILKGDSKVEKLSTREQQEDDLSLFSNDIKLALILCWENTNCMVSAETGQECIGRLKKNYFNLFHKTGLK